MALLAGVRRISRLFERDLHRRRTVLPPSEARFCGCPLSRMQTFDLIVIGSGPAGQRAAIQAAKSGQHVALVEKVHCMGGVCVNTGTIPSKTMREAVLHLSGYQYQNVYGVNYRVKEKISMADLAFRVQHVIRTEIEVTISQLSRNGIEVITGVANFTDARHVHVRSSRSESDYEADVIVIATGTKP